MIVEVYNRFMFNGFNIVNAIKDVHFLNKSKNSYEDNVSKYLLKVGNNYGVVIEKFEVYSEDGLSISMVKNNNIINVTIFETDFYDNNSERSFSVEFKSLNKNINKEDVDYLMAFQINDKLKQIKDKKMKFFSNKEDLLKELNNESVSNLLSSYRVRNDVANKQWNEARLRI